jgi:hypothetical protein
MATFISIPHVLVLSEEGQLVADTELRSVRAQAALVRSLLDELDVLAPPSVRVGHAESIAAQALEELTHLACKMMETAAAIAPERVAELCLHRWSVPPA